MLAVKWRRRARGDRGPGEGLLPSPSRHEGTFVGEVGGVNGGSGFPIRYPGKRPTSSTSAFLREESSLLGSVKGREEESKAKSLTWFQALLLLQQSTGRVRLGRA
jgi:hypothetical protein